MANHSEEALLPVEAPRLDLQEVRSEEELAFVRALHSRAERGGWYALAWPDPLRLIVTIDVIPPGERFVTRMLRVDFFGDHMQVGPDRTFQLATDLTEPKIFGRPEMLAEQAADWLEREMARPIGHDVRGTKEVWYLADTGEQLVWRAASGLVSKPPR